MVWIAFITGLFVGAAIGIVAVCLCVHSAKAKTGSKVHVALEVADKGSAILKKFRGNADQAFDKLKKYENKKN